MFFRIIGDDKKEYGPISLAQLRQWMAESRVNGQTLIRTEEGGEWRPLSSLPELESALATRNVQPGPPAAASTSDPVSAVIPYRNIPALISYYLAVFSLLPCLGIPLGIAAVVLGVAGLKRAREQPEARGKVHAWIGIILGGILSVAYTIALGLIFIHRTGDSGSR